MLNFRFVVCLLNIKTSFVLVLRSKYVILKWILYDLNLNCYGDHMSPTTSSICYLSHIIKKKKNVI